MCRSVHRPVYVHMCTVAHVYLSSVRMYLRVCEFVLCTTKFCKIRSDHFLRTEAMECPLRWNKGGHSRCHERSWRHKGRVSRIQRFYSRRKSENGWTWTNMDEYGLKYWWKSFMLSRGRDCSSCGAGQDYLKLWNVIDWITIAFGFTTVSLGVRRGSFAFFAMICFHLWRIVERVLSSALFWNKDTGRWTWWTHHRNPSQIESQCLDSIW